MALRSINVDMAKKETLTNPKLKQDSSTFILLSLLGSIQLTIEQVNIPEDCISIEYLYKLYMMLSPYFRSHIFGMCYFKIFYATLPVTPRGSQQKQNHLKLNFEFQKFSQNLSIFSQGMGKDAPEFTDHLI